MRYRAGVGIRARSVWLRSRNKKNKTGTNSTGLELVLFLFVDMSNLTSSNNSGPTFFLSRYVTLQASVPATDLHNDKV